MARKRRRGKVVPEGLFEASIDSLASDARGVAHIEGKATFIDGALPGEAVVFRYTRCRSKYDEGVVEQVVEPSPDRVIPKCEYASICGGCSLQHLSPAAQIRMKQQTLLDNLKQIGGVEPASVLPALTGDTWGYRRKARLGVRDVRAKGRVLVGFREQRNRYLADIKSCEVLHPTVGHRLEALSDLIGLLHARTSIAQIEVAVSDELTALVFRHMEPIDDHDGLLLIDYAKNNDCCIYLQSGGVDTITPLWPTSPCLQYRLETFDITLEFLPSDFTQVNASINVKMSAQAVDLLEINEDDHVLDLFCGLGNFTLACATRAPRVTGVEGEPGLVERAKSNAKKNQLNNVEFHTADLFSDITSQAWSHRNYDKLLLDPPRSGAQNIVENIRQIKPQRIVYVSCHPGTLARDAGILSAQGYHLLSAGVMDMFPHTTHVESMAIFERK